MNAELLLHGLDAARDSAVQLLMLAALIVAISVIFARTVLGVDSQRGAKLLALSWFVYLISIVFGVGVLMSITGNLAIAAGGGPLALRGDCDAELGLRTLSPYESNISYFAFGQLMSFCLACGLLAVFGSFRLRVMNQASRPASHPRSPERSARS
jgi:hypothetical protein